MTNELNGSAASEPLLSRRVAVGGALALGRRTFLKGGTATGVLLILGCSPAGNGNRDGAGELSGLRQASAKERPAMMVYRDPNCPCCESWAEIARRAGYQVQLVEDPDMVAVKQRLGVPAALASCHTTVVDDLVAEGHVPIPDIERLLRERPPGVKGIAVPGMPLGSPGMEAPDRTVQPYEVIAFGQDGSTSVFATHGQA